MTRTLRLALVLLLATSVMVVIPGEAEATVPGDIGRIAFLSDKDHASGEIYVRDFAGSNPVRITNNADPDYLPKWSPDGTKIAFSRFAGGVIDVFVMDPDGSNVTNLTNGVSTANDVLDWSPDGSRILFTSDRGPNQDLWVMNADGSAPTQLTDTPASEGSAAWSPNGTTIAFSAYSGTSDIWLIDANGANPRNITNDAADDGSPAWSPDSTRIAYSSGPFPHPQIWVMNADGSGAAIRASAPGTGNWSPAWSPDGSKIAFTSDRDGDSDIWMMNPDGTDLSHLTNNPANERTVSWESVNRPPVAVDDEVEVWNCGMVTIDNLGNDYDPDGEPLVEVDIIGPMTGTVGTDAAGNTVYVHGCLQPPPSGTRTDSFDYLVEDPRGGSDWATVTITIYPGFIDVPAAHLFFDDIHWLADQGITRGCNPPENTLFCPEEFVTRGQMAAFLVRALHYTAGAGADLFVDDNGSVFEDDIDRLGTAGVTRGCNPPVNDRFCPTSNVTRGQMAAFLARAFNLTDLGMHDLFVDDNDSVFEADIDKLGATGVSRGCNPPANDRFCPNQNVTRAQMAAFIRRAVDYTT